ncbi:MAG: hypothetical protein HC902_04430 [Calothrix sp. SM1_5_4]|nr:hypothetical protein [Calothrix sp. SM1_5_4]
MTDEIARRLSEWEGATDNNIFRFTADLPRPQALNFDTTNENWPASSVFAPNA